MIITGTKLSTCSRCGRAIKYEYEYNGEIFGSTCIFRELGISFSDEQLYDIRTNHNGNINDYIEFMEREEQERQARAEEKKQNIYDSNRELILSIIDAFNLNVNIDDIEIESDIIKNNLLAANLSSDTIKVSIENCTLIKKIIQNGIYNDYYYMVFKYDDYEIHFDTSAKKMLELEIGDVCNLFFNLDSIYNKDVNGKRPKVIN
jgi:hypothetical protein